MNLEMTIFQIITHSGDAKSILFEAIEHAKSGNQVDAEAKVSEAKEKILLAHKEQTSLIQGEAGGQKSEISLLMIHAQDHLMNTILFKDLATEIIDLHRKVLNLEASK